MHNSNMSNEAKVPKLNKNILERLNDGEVIVGDGGYVIELERRGYVTGGWFTPEATVEHPYAVEALHREFARSGSDVLQAFTFRGSNDRIETSNCKATGNEINEAACKIVKKVCEETGCMWAGGLSPTTLYENGGSKEDVQESFRSQTKIFVEQNADFLIAEFFHVCEELEWAVEVLKETTKPVAATMCIDSTSDCKGVPTEECAVRLVKAGADIVGVNCKFDPNESLKAVAKMKEGLETAGLKAHLMFQPLAFHCSDAGKDGYKYTNLPESHFAMEPRTLTRWDVHKITRKAYDLGARYIGGCCGFQAYHIRAIGEELAAERGRLPESSENHKPFVEGRYREDKTKEFWMNLEPGCGRPLCPGLSGHGATGRFWYE